MARYKSVAKGESRYRGATYLKGPTSINHFVVRPFSPKWFKEKREIEIGRGHKGSLKSCFFSILFNNISLFLIVCPAAKSSQPTYVYYIWKPM